MEYSANVTVWLIGATGRDQPVAGEDGAAGVETDVPRIEGRSRSIRPDVEGAAVEEDGVGRDAGAQFQAAVDADEPGVDLHQVDKVVGRIGQPEGPLAEFLQDDAGGAAGQLAVDDDVARLWVVLLAELPNCAALLAPRVTVPPKVNVPKSDAIRVMVYAVIGDIAVNGVVAEAGQRALGGR